MKDKPLSRKNANLLAGYYGVLQISHLITLTWAGSVLLRTGQVPFPAQPPPGGWHAQALPFLLAMGLLDAGAAGLGVYFASSWLFHERWRVQVGLLSTAMALTSAGIFAAGTWAAGVWLQYPLSYFGMLVLSLPVFPLFWFLLTAESPQ
jgi:hypothetical protein